MRRITAWYSLAALLLALVYAPLFHLHAEDHDHGVETLVHTHFPQQTNASQDAHHALEPEHASRQERPLDVLTANASYTPTHTAIAFHEFSPMPLVRIQYAGVPVETARAHDPPDYDASAPRSPPSR